MEISVEKINAAVPVGVIATHGDLDASNYMSLVEKAQSVYQSGLRNILLDLTDTPFISSSGLVALHSVALLLRGEAPLDPAEGWNTFQQMDRNMDLGVQEHVKLLNPQPRVSKTLERAGLNAFFEIFTDRKAAIASFQPEGTQLHAAS